MSSSNDSVCPLPEGLRYYILRRGAMVPLVPIDQLAFQIPEIPKHLTHRQLSDGNWRFLAETSSKPAILSLQAPSALASSQSLVEQSRFQAPDHQVRSQTPPKHTESFQPDSQLSTPSTKGEAGKHATRSFTSAVPRPSPLTDSFDIACQSSQALLHRASSPSDTITGSPKKEFCTYWIRTGNCSFLSMGCKYKHEMPDPEKLRALGFNDGTPRWWREKNAIALKEQAWIQRRLAHADRERKANGTPALRSFPDSIAVRRFKAKEPELVKGDSTVREKARKIATKKSRETPDRDLSASPTKAAGSISRRMSSLLIDLGDASTPLSSHQESDYLHAAETSAMPELSKPTLPLQRTEKDLASHDHCCHLHAPSVSESDANSEAMIKVSGQKVFDASVRSPLCVAKPNALTKSKHAVDDLLTKDLVN